MIVPRLSAVEQLHEAHAAFDQSPGDQAARAVLAGFVLIETVQLVRGFGFLRDVERLGGRCLHAGGQFVAGDACFQVRLAGMIIQVPLVQRLQQVQVLPLHAHRPDAAAVAGSESAVPGDAARFPETAPA